MFERRVLKKGKEIVHDMYHRNETTRNILNRTSAPEMYVGREKSIKMLAKVKCTLSISRT